MIASVATEGGTSYAATQLCLTLSEVGNSYRYGLRKDVYLRDRRGRTLLTQEDSYNAFRVLARGAAREFGRALQPLVQIAKAYRAGLIDMPTDNVVVQNEKGYPLLTLSDVLNAERLLAA